MKNENEFDYFEVLSDCMTETGTKMYESFSNDIAKHLIMLEHKLEKCFLEYSCDLIPAEEPIHYLLPACTFTD